ncbi:unnamed protein product [Cyprideis torosa]|uniref:Uncharacterized protein n=1 Tax=Cyprideis torosa TaxID=163714 RepID=A0A7R8WL45_9CRUS|nr:unnamed protein product [Cyprideis torosa]CAG0903911.1 unnamed protein product [Cyprideis torosa]
MNPVEVFEFFFDGEYFALLQREIRRYIPWKEKSIQEPSIDELKAVMAIQFFSGYHCVPSRRHYWSNDPDLHVSFVADIISRNRFDAILSILHFADNQRLNRSDRMAKLRPLMDHCGAAVKILVDKLPEQIRKDSLHIYTDNLFTSYPLMKAFKSEGIGSTGTMRQNRLKGCPLKSVAAMKTVARGSMSVVVEMNSGIYIVRWNDNAPVTIASTVHGTKPMVDVKRYSQKEKKHIKVPQPKLIQEYNRAMGGTDTMDQNVSSYRIGIRQRKYWWCIYNWILGATMQNSWLIYRLYNPNTSQLDFIRAVVRSYLAKSVKPPGGRPSGQNASARVLSSIRFDGRDHLPLFVQ